jgi:uncharacterized protein (TIGR02466 family)
MEKNLYELFPTNVYQTTLDTIDNSFIFDELQKKPHDNHTVRNGWQTVRHLHKDEEFGELVGQIYEFFDELIVDIFSPKRPMELKHEITSMWGTLTTTDGHCVDHIHPRSFMSGVYYVKVPSNSGNIVFKDPRPASEWEDNGFLYNNMSPTAYLPVKEGMLLLFPGWLRHRTELNKSDEQRVSISFNIQQMNVRYK